MKKLAIIDWGVGGISLYKLVHERLGIPVTYLSDTGVTPYGKMSRTELVSRLNAVISYLLSAGITHLVIGCNAASTEIQSLDLSGITVEGMIDNGIAAAAAKRPERLSVIGGRRTILSGAYRRGFSDLGINVRQRIAQPLSGLIEGGDVSSDRLRSEAVRILKPIRNSTHILLACTHYPAIANLLARIVGPGTSLVDPAETLVDKVASWKIAPGGLDIFLTTGDPRAMKRAAQLAFGVKIASAKKIKI